MGHAAADDNCVDLVDHVVDHVDFVRDLGSAQDGHEGALGGLESIADEFDFLFNEVTGYRGQEFGDPFVGGMTPVGAAEGVVYGKVRQLCQLLGEDGVVFLFLGVEAEIFQQEDFPGL